MSLLMIIFLINATNIKPLADYDSLEDRTVAEPVSEEEVDPVLQYTFGMDTYRAGFNKGSISTNTLEEEINTSNGNLELKIKLLSLPMRGNKDYDLYLTYRGSPLSIPGMQVPYPSYKTYGYDAPPYDVEDSLLQENRNQYIVSSDMGNCGLGWNVMPGEVSCNPYWQQHYVSSDSIWNERRDGFIHLNGGEKYGIYNIWRLETDDWFISGKRNWNLNIQFQPILSTPENTYEFSDYTIWYPNPKNIPGGDDHQRELYTLEKITDRNGNYVDIDWWSDDSPPEARIPEKICTPTDTCYIYGSSIAVDTNEKLPSYDRYCLWDFWVIDSIVRNVNGEKFKVNFYYHQEWFDMILEYWYGHAFVLLDSVEFLKDGERIKPPYRFEYDTRYNNSDPERRQGELITLITPDSAKYEYWYAEKSKSCCKYGQLTCNNPYKSSYRVVNKKVVTLPDTAHIEFGDGSNPDGVYEYEYLFGNSVGPSSGHWNLEGVNLDEWVFYPLTYYPIYDYCTINMPDTGSITYLNIDSTYMDNLLDVIERPNGNYAGNHDPLIIRPFDSEEFYGKPYKIVTSNSENWSGNNNRVKLEQFYWTISDKVLPSDAYYCEYPLHPFLRYKATQMDPEDDNINVTEKATVYYYPEYDKYDNKKTIRFLGEATLTGTSSYDVVGNSQRWRVYGIPEWSDADGDHSDNWEVKNGYLYEQNSEYADSFLYNLVDSTIKSDYNGNLAQKTKFEYDNPSHLVNIYPDPPCHDPEYGTSHTIRGNLTKKTEWINSSDTRSQQYWYDICGNLVEMKDYIGETYELYYDSDYVFPDSVVSPDGFKTDFNFDKKGRITSVTDKSGIIDSFEYDIYGRIKVYRKGVSGSMAILGKYKYDDFGRKAKEITYNSAGSSDTTIYSYDGLGRLINVEKYAPNSVLIDYIYNGNGQVVKETHPRFDNVSLYDAYFTIKTFDGLGRVTEIEYPKSPGDPDEFVEYFYYGDTTKVFDEEGDSTKLINDASGNLIQVEDALGNETYYLYDVNDNLIEIEDAEGKHIYFEYDWFGNLVRREGPDRGVDLFEYYPDGQLKFRWNNAGDKIEIEYDELGRIKKKKVNGQVKETYYYDDYDDIGGDTYDPPDSIEYSEGRLTGFENPDVKEVYYYNKFGSLVEKLVIPSTEEEKTFQYAYDLQGRLTELKYPDGDYKVEYEYDKLGNVSLVEIDDEETITLSSTAAGLLSGVNFPGYVTNTFTYRPRNWMESMEIDGINTFYSREFEYNKRGELRRELNGDNLTAQYDYDGLGRIILDSRYQEGSYYHNFVYDPVGNRLEMDYGNIQYEYYTGTNRLKNDSESEYTYDGNGYLSSKENLEGTTNFTYDPEGKLTVVEHPDGETGYKYYYKGNQRIREEKITDIEYTQTLEAFSYFCQLKSDAIAEAKLIAVFLNENNDSIGYDDLGEINGDHNDWVEFSGVIPKENFPSGTENLKLKVKRSGMSPDGYLWVGNVSMGIISDEEIVATVDQTSDYYYDNAGNLILVNSAGMGSAENVVQNPGFETGDLTGWDGGGWEVTNQYPQESEYSLYYSGHGERIASQEIPISGMVSDSITISCWIIANFNYGGGF